MRIIKTIAEFQEYRKSVLIAKPDAVVGFIPTMGCLHQGHLSLVKKAKLSSSSPFCHVVVVSIFVNPAQFAPHEDFDSYPRQTEIDLSLLRSLTMSESDPTPIVDAVFLPNPQDMYPGGHSSLVCKVNAFGVDHTLEAQSRPGFFSGVATVVTKLFNIVKPTVAFFGQKDAVQLHLIRKMVRDLNFDIQIVAGDIIREPNGVAMSSRNNYLPAEDRERASIIFKSLQRAATLFSQGQRNVETLTSEIKALLQSEPHISKIDYIMFDDYETFKPVPSVIDPHTTVIISLAVIFSGTRLIDNIILGAQSD